MVHRAGDDGRRVAGTASGVLGDPTVILEGSIEIIVCDWNGTLVADADRACTATNAVLTARQLPSLDLPAFLAAFSLPLGTFLRDLGVPEEDLTGAVGEWNAAMASQPACLAPGAMEFLRTARALGIRTGVMSAAATEAVAADVAALGIEDLLDFLVGSVASKSGRLAPLVVAATGTVLYVGDTEYDVTEALAARAAPIAVGNGYRPADALLKAGAVCVVPDLMILASLLAANMSRNRE